MKENKTRCLDFIEDLRNLYCKTRISSIEDVFIKLSKTYSGLLYNWLSSNTNIRSSLNDPFVFDVLQLLVKIREKYPSNVTVNDMVEYFTGSRDINSLSYIMAFSSFLDDQFTKGLLEPFGDIITASSAFSGGREINKNTIADDLHVIAKEFNNKVESYQSKTYDDHDTISPKKKNGNSLRDRRIKMFSYLLQRFSDDVSSAAESMGASDFAERVRSEALLAKPNEMATYMPINKATLGYIDKEVKWLMKEILRSPQEEAMPLVYEMVKRRLFDFSGVANQNELRALQQYIEGMRDPTKYMQPFSDSEEEIETSVPKSVKIVPDAKWIDPQFLIVLSLLLYGINKEVSSAAIYR